MRRDDHGLEVVDRRELEGFRIGRAGHVQWLSSRNTRELILATGESGWLDDDEVAALTQAHATFVDAGLACTLDRRPRRLPINDAIASAREAISAAAHRHGLVFDQYASR